jgi:hypothetical protein
VIVVLLLIHSVSAVLLLGAITHQALAVWWPTPQRGAGWWRSLRGVHPERYVQAIWILYCITALLGALLYPTFRSIARAEYLDANAPWATGLFEIKEHAVALGLALLPAYWAVWREPATLPTRRLFTTSLAILVWWNFLVGHIVNNVRGL